MEADYVIVGAGSAGCVLADRLTAAGHSVILLEAGPRDRSPLIHIPAGVMRLINHPVYNWNFSTEPQPLAGNRVVAIPRGRALGGTSSINGMNFVRGHAEDFNAWAQSGCRGWSFTDVLPYFRSIESYDGGANEERGGGGPITVQPYRTVLPVTDRFVEAAQQAGFAFKRDLNSGPLEGVGHSQMSRRGRFRQSTAVTFLAAAKRRPTLRIETDAIATKLLFDGRRCTGVAFHQHGQPREARARREVIVCGGTVKSPQILQISGIGPANHLQSLGIDVVHDLPGVGSNLNDHFAAAIVARVKSDVVTNNQLRRFPRLPIEVARWVLNGRGAFSSGASTATAYGRSREGLGSPDIQFLFFPGSADPRNPYDLEREPGIRLSVSLARPRSRGTIMAKSADPFAAPAINPNYLADPDDLRVVLAGLRTARKIFAQPALADVIVREMTPGPANQSDEELERHVRATGATIHHIVGTCRMGEDPRAVVDSRLRVHGLAGLRVIDASVMPQVTTGNTNAATIMIGEKGAAMVLEDAR